MNQSSDIEQ